MEEPKITRWWWVRHAPIIGYTGQIFGQSDPDCDLSNNAAIAWLARQLPPDAQWVTSHLSRTTKTAQALQQEMKLYAAPREIRDLAEQSFGDWEELDWNAIRNKDAKTHDAFWQDPFGNAPPGGESLKAFMGRCEKAVDKLNDEFVGQDIIAVTHAGTIRSAIAQALDLSAEKSLSLQIDNLSLTRLDHFPDATLKGKGGHWRTGAINRIA